MGRIIVILALAGLSGLQAAEGWRELFNGKDLQGWKANLYPDSWSVVDGAIRAHATKESSHLFVMTAQGEPARFKNFELEAVVRGEPNANSGIFVHTDLTTHSEAMRLSKGYEIQLNSTAKEKRKTGSLYGVVDLPTSPVDETKWFRVGIAVRGKRLTIQLEGKTVVDFTEAEPAAPVAGRPGRKLDPEGGAIALQAHDPTSVFYFKSVRVRELP